MKPEEFKKLIAESKNFEWFNTVSETLNFNYLNSSINLKGVTSIYDFFYQQREGWASLGNDLPNDIIKSKDYFRGVNDSLIQFVNTYKDYDINVLNGQWQNFRNTLYNLSAFPFRYDAPETDYLVRLYKENSAYYKSAYEFFKGRLEVNLQDKNNLIGAFLAYEFSFKDSLITERRNTEKASLNRLKNDFQSYLGNSEQQLTAFLNNATNKYNEYSQAIDEIKRSKEESFSQWFEETKKSFFDFDNNSNKKMTDLEKAYEGLLRLKKPAEYWHNRAVELKKEGWLALHWLIALVAFGCATLYMLLWLTPEGMLLSFIKGQASAIKWSLIYITFISFLAFGIRALNKVTFSSFHLARDAEEREQLTFVYLAMIKDSSVDIEDRHLIMQSLFSRADTGLLKDESSPTMPGTSSIIEKVIK